MSMTAFSFVLLLFSWVLAVAGEAHAGELFARHAWVAVTPEAPAGAEPAPAPSDAPHPLKNVVKRRVDASLPLFLPVSFTLPSNDQEGYPAPSGFHAIPSRSVPLYRFLRVYRF
ncbi:MAG: hypothetical protein NZ578_03945 [Candidatus Binatia bacterium]|nr:hypothetical protein [Candidatus Binatia bacterium]